MAETVRKLHELEQVLGDSRRILILMHDNPDPDAIAAALGFQHLVRNRGGEGTLAYGGIVGRAENQSMIQHLKIGMTPLERLRLEDYGTIALVDTQPGTGNNSLPDTVVPDIVIDHHPLRPETRKVPFRDVREKVGASSSIMTSYLRAWDTAIPPRLATALYYGIKSDTNDLGRNASSLDMESYLHLFPKVQRNVLNRIIHPKVSGEYFKVLNRAFKRARIQGSVLTTAIGRIKNPDMVAEIADMLLRHEGVEWVLAMGTFQRALILSIRTSDILGGAGTLAQEIVRGLGKAGGHGMMAGGKVDLQGRPVRELETRIQERFLKKVGAVNQPVEALV